MGKIVKTTDFVGDYSISQNRFTAGELQTFIDKFEKEYLYDLLGFDLGSALYNDIAPNTFLPPATPLYATLFNELAVDSYCGYESRSKGIKDMLMGFIYWEYVRKQPVINTITGPEHRENEVSAPFDWNETDIYNVYNESVKSYKAIQQFIHNDLVPYPTYKGSPKKLANWFL